MIYNIISSIIEYEIKGWEGYYLSISDSEINVYSSWGFVKGKSLKDQPRLAEIKDVIKVLELQ